MKYNVTVYYCTGIDFEVEAETPEEAKAKALDIDLPEAEFAARLTAAEYDDASVFDEGWHLVL